ncbi:MAG: Uma2 family endonuclease [Eubacterium sp.]|nr:Uma2 family endonuclease [Eubacterium sp.]
MDYRENKNEPDTVIRQQPAYMMNESDESDEMIRSIYEEDYSRSGNLTIADLEATPEDRRVELINGVFYDMAEPLLVHQRIAGTIYRQIGNYIENNNGKCMPYISPVGVKPHADDDRTIVEPDVIVVCNPDKQQHPRYIIGGPDLVVEVLSPSTKKRDLVVKKKIYQSAGVREYWIVDPEARYVFVYRFEKDNVTFVHTFDDAIPVWIYDGQLEIRLDGVMETD